MTILRHLARAAALAGTGLLLSAGVTACTPADAAEQEPGSIPTPAMPAIRGVERAVVTAAPNVPAPISRKHATKVIVELTTIEKRMRLADGVDYTFWTFDGHVPGSFVRVR